MKKTKKSGLLLSLLVLALTSISIIPINSSTIELPQSFNTQSKVRAAYEPMQLTNQITDPANLLTADTPLIQQQFDKAEDQSGVRVYVVFVPDFIDPTDSDQWIQQTGQLSNLGNNSVIFAVATQSGKAAIYIPSNSEKLKKKNLETVSASVVQLLSVQQWSKAVIEFSTEIAAQANSNFVLLTSLIVIGVIALGVFIALICALVSKRRAKTRNDKPKRIREPAI